MHFPAWDGTTKRASRIKQRKIWLQHRSDKTGDSNDAYYAAAWHIPLKVLQDYALSQQKPKKAHFPWCMSKEDGLQYNCHESLEVVYEGSKKATNDAFYFVAPIMTTDLLHLLHMACREVLLGSFIKNQTFQRVIRLSS